jgi:hypothetical protein
MSAKDHFKAVAIDSNTTANRCAVNETKPTMTIDCLLANTANMRGNFDADIVVWQRGLRFG